MLRSTENILARPAAATALLALATLLGTVSATGQEVPATDVWLVELEPGDPPVPRAPRNLTDRAGYDNQPSFTADGSALLYTSIADGQADIMRLDLTTGERTAVIATPESEYSPTPVDGDRALSVVRVEADERQRLWRFPMTDGGGPAPALLLPDVEPVGYHAWVDERRLILFVLGEPPTLELATVDSEITHVLASNVGRSLARIPGDGRMSFIDRRDDGEWWVTAIDPDDRSRDPLVRTRPESEDVAWAPDGSLWTGDGSVLWRWRPGSDDGWLRVADLADAGIRGITRLAFDPEGRRLALVAERPAP